MIRNALRLILIGLLLPGSFATAGSGGVLEPAELASLRADVRADLRAAAGRADDAEAAERALKRARTEPDPVRREAMLSAWLRDWIGPDPGFPAPVAALEALLAHPQIVRTVHPDHPGHDHAAFNVATLARNRLTEQRIRDAAARSVDRPDRIAAQLAAPAGSEAFRAGLRAMERSGSVTRGTVTALLETRRAKGAASDPAQLALVRNGLLAPDILPLLVARAEPRVALAALREAVSRAAPDLGAVLHRALDRPELGGLPIHHAARHTDAALRSRLWPLLDDPERGADAALALARTAPDLEARIERRFDTAPARTRLRMLLALHLRDTETSRALLERLESGRLAAAETELVRRWR